nr:hypothetical protein [uncultured Campylobacter sp.]
MKVAISFVDTADVAAKPQDRLRFSFGGAAAQKRNAARRCEVVIRDVYYDTAFERFMASQSVQRFKNGVRKRLEIATNKNSLALSA